MSRFLIWCFNDTRSSRKESKTSSEKEANRMYAQAVKSGLYSSVTLRREEKTYGKAIKSWSKSEGEVLLH